MRTNTRKIQRFLSQLHDVEFEYLKICLQMVYDAKNLISEFQLTPEQFCAFLHIDTAQYANYLSGAYNYDLKSIACMQAAYVTLKSQQAAKEAETNFVDVVK